MVSGVVPDSVNQNGLAPDGCGEFPSTIDRPAGRTDCVISAVTKRPLRYFTPDPLRDLLDRCGSVKNPRLTLANDGLSFMLARLAAKRGVDGQVDPHQAKRFCDVVARRIRLDNYSSLLKLGNAISPRNHGLREEILFAGASVASSARTVFAPHAQIPALMRGLSQEITCGARDMDSGAAAAIIGFYCVSMHPFLDGNGRWSRLVAMAYGMSAGDATSAMINAAFQNVAKAELADVIWPRTCAFGLRAYVDASWRFENVLVAALGASGLLKAVVDVAAELEASAPGRRVYQEIMISLGADGVIPLIGLKAHLGQSQRAHEGMLERLFVVGNRWIAIDNGNLSLRHAQAEIERSAMNAVREMFT